MIASPATLRALELERLLSVIAELAATDVGRQWVESRAPSADREEIAERWSRLDEAKALLEEGALIAAEDLPVAPLLDALRPGRASLSGADIVRLASLLRSLRQTERRYSSSPEVEELFPAMARLSAGLDIGARERAAVDAMTAAVDRTLDATGEVRDSASPRLRTLSRSVRRRREALYGRFADYVREHRKSLAEETTSMRDGRLTVLLPSGGRGRLAGLVHGRSATGKSFYFEPLEMVEPNNELHDAVGEEAAERQRLLRLLLVQATELQPVVERYGRLLRELDGLQALARFGSLVAGCGPPLAGDELVLVAARHPLLDPALADLRQAVFGSPGHTGPVVPLDLDFAGDRVLVITGPNAGGKTVALKTLGLLVLAAQSGIPFPCGSATRLPVFRQVVALVGDEQDLLTDRSTFSARLLRLREVWDAAAADSLVLVDEIGSGTNPQEGAALGIALLEELVAQGGRALMTTHLTELAVSALETPGARCLGMELDAANHRPTFRLRSGTPVGSEALALARRLGLPEPWLERAESRLGSEQLDWRRLVAQTQRLRVELEERRDELERRLAEERRLAAELEAERGVLRDEHRSLKRRYRAAMEDWRRSVEGRLREEVERLGEEALSARQKRRRVAEGASRLVADPPPLLRSPEPEDEGSASGAAVTVGASVRHRRLGWRGVVERLQRDQAQVRVQGKRLRCEAVDLQVLPAPVPASSGGRGKRGRVEVPQMPEVPAEINLIGQRVDAALASVDSYLDRALLASAPRVRVIHGHGSGRLRQALREHLRHHPAVESLVPAARNEGGDGATVVTLRDGAR